MSDSRIRLVPLLLEAGFVVLGVFLALAANEWREDRHDRERAEIARQTILDELHANRAALAESSAFNASRLDTLSAYLPADRPPPPPELFGQSFLRPAPLLSTAWDAAQATDAVSHMPYDEVLQYAGLYAMQDAYFSQAEGIGLLLYDQMMDVGFMGLVAKHRNYYSVLVGFGYFERQLAQAYDRVLVPPDSVASD